MGGSNSIESGLGQRMAEGVGCGLSARQMAGTHPLDTVRVFKFSIPAKSSRIEENTAGFAGSEMVEGSIPAMESLATLLSDNAWSE